MTRLADGVYRRGRRLWIRYSVAGHEYREPVDTASVKRAQALRGDRIAAVKRGERSPAGDRLTVSDLLDLVVTDHAVNGRRSLAQSRGQLEAVRRALGTVRARDVTTDQIQRVQRAWQAAGAANATINRRGNFLRRGYRLAYQARLLPLVPYVPRLREDTRRARYHQAADVARYLTELPDYIRPLVAFAQRNGTRRGQLTRTRRQYVDLGRGVIAWPAAEVKADAPHVLPLDAVSLALVRAALREARPWCPYLWHGPRCAAGRHGSARYGCVGDFKRAWAAAMERAGLPVGRRAGGYTFHGLRHTFATDWIAAGGSVADAQAVGGWKTPSMVAHYNLGNVEALRARLSTVREAPTAPRRLRGPR
jgi:integrase